MRTNREIRAREVRVIGANGDQVGVMSAQDALRLAEEQGLDLVEIAPQAKPPVCKVIDYGKFRYQIAKKEKESKKAQHQVKVKEIKVRPNIDSHDFDFKVKRAKEFLEKGFKVKLACFFRGREMMFKDKGKDLLDNFCKEVQELGQADSPPKAMGRSMTLVISPNAGKGPKKKKGVNDDKSEKSKAQDEQSS